MEILIYIEILRHTMTVSACTPHISYPTLVESHPGIAKLPAQQSQNLAVYPMSYEGVTRVTILDQEYKRGVI
jgi:hypothetical protein